MHVLISLKTSELELKVQTDINVRESLHACYQSYKLTHPETMSEIYSFCTPHYLQPILILLYGKGYNSETKLKLGQQNLFLKDNDYFLMENIHQKCVPK